MGRQRPVMHREAERSKLFFRKAEVVVTVEGRSQAFVPEGGVAQVEVVGHVAGRGHVCEADHSSDGAVAVGGVTAVPEAAIHPLERDTVDPAFEDVEAPHRTHHRVPCLMKGGALDFVLIRQLGNGIQTGVPYAFEVEALGWSRKSAHVPPPYPGVDPHCRTVVPQRRAARRALHKHSPMTGAAGGLRTAGRDKDRAGLAQDPAAWISEGDTRPADPVHDHRRSGGAITLEHKGEPVSVTERDLNEQHRTMAADLAARHARIKELDPDDPGFDGQYTALVERAGELLAFEGRLSARLAEPQRLRSASIVRWAWRAQTAVAVALIIAALALGHTAWWLVLLIPHLLATLMGWPVTVTAKRHHQQRIVAFALQAQGVLVVLVVLGVLSPWWIIAVVIGWIGIGAFSEHGPAGQEATK